MLKKPMLIGLGVLLLPLVAVAGHKMCGGQNVPASVRSCPDGSMPLYVADEIKLNPARQSAAAPGRAETHNDSGSPAIANPSDYFGVWRTRIPGAVWTSPSGYRGYDLLHVSAGLATGDLIIKPDETYVWQAYGGKSGRWVQGDREYPIVLIDSVENRRWKVGADPKHTGGRDIIVWDGNALYYDGRK